MSKNPELGDRPHTTSKERQIYDEAIDVFLEMIAGLKNQNPELDIKSLVAQLTGALSEAGAIASLREK